MHVEDVAKIVLVVFLAVAAAIFALHALLAVIYRYPIDYGEGPLVDQAMRLAAGQNIYRTDISSPPYTISNYPPLFVLSLAPFVKLFGPSFLPGRLISLSCTLASSFLLARIVYALSRDRFAAAVSGLLFLAVPYVVGWSIHVRVDMLALALSLAGLTVLARWPLARRGLIVSALLLVAAVYTRQSYGLAAPLAAFAWLWTQARRRAAALVALVGGVGLTLFLALNVLTQGGFYFNVVTANVNEFGLERLRWWLDGLLEVAPILLVLGGFYLFLGLRQAKPWPLLGPYLVGACLSTLAIGKIGSTINYFLELCAALSLVAGALVARNRERPWLRAALLVLLASQTGLLMRSTLNWRVEGLRQRVSPTWDPQDTTFRDLEWLVKTADGPILADEFMGLLALQKVPLYIQPFEVTQLANDGVWDQTPVLESIRRHEFPVILIHNFMGWLGYKERWTPEMLVAIMEEYVPTELLADTIVYRPRDVQRDGPADLEACPGAPWRLPTRSELGAWWSSRQLTFMGQGYEYSVPVYAVADGLLTRGADWHDKVAIQHDDPLRPGEKVWTYYGGMASGEDAWSFVVSDFPPGSEALPVRKGHLLGYQGQWFRKGAEPIWVHLRFAVLRPAADGSFPAEALRLMEEEPWPGVRPPGVLALGQGPLEEGPLDPSPYLGTVGSPVMGRRTWIPLRCQSLESTQGR